jgi:hypothetical protein
MVLHQLAEMTCKVRQLNFFSIAGKSYEVDCPTTRPMLGPCNLALKIFYVVGLLTIDLIVLSVRLN